MAKYWCMFALAGLAAGAPSPRVLRVSPAIDQSNIISGIMLRLQPSIDAAITRALGESTSTAVYVQESIAPAVNYGSSAAAYQNGVQGGKTVQSAGVNGLVYFGQGTGSQYNSASVSGPVYQETIGNFKTKVALSASNQEGLVQSVMGALAPSINAAVMAALANLEQESSISTSSFASGGQQVSGISGQVSGIIATEQVSSTASLAEEKAIVAQICKILNPSITQAVRKALASRVEIVHVQTLPVSTISQQQSSAGISNQQQSSFTSSNQQSTIESTESQTSSDSSVLIAQIIAALKPSISLSVQNAIQANAETVQVQRPVTIQVPPPVTTISQQQSSIDAATQQQSSLTSSNQQSSFESSVSESSSEAMLIAQIIAALKPSIALSVQNAIQANAVTSTQTVVSDSNQGFGSFTADTGFSSQSSLDTSNQQQSSFTSSNQQSSFESSASQSSSEALLIAQIIAALKPSIALSVQNAIQANQATSSQNIGSSGFSSNVGFSSQSSAGTSNQQQSSFISSNQQSSSASQSSSESSKLIAQIIAALRPSIALAIQNAIQANQATSTQTFVSESNQGFGSSDFSSQSESSGFSSSSSGSISSGSLSDIFGNGGVNNVKIETPQYSIEYSN